MRSCCTDDLTGRKPNWDGEIECTTSLSGYKLASSKGHTQLGDMSEIVIFRLVTRFEVGRYNLNSLLSSGRTC